MEPYFATRCEKQRFAAEALPSLAACPSDPAALESLLVALLRPCRTESLLDGLAAREAVRRRKYLVQALHEPSQLRPSRTLQV